MIEVVQNVTERDSRLRRSRRGLLGCMEAVLESVRYSSLAAGRAMQLAADAAREHQAYVIWRTIRLAARVGGSDAKSHV